VVAFGRRRVTMTSVLASAVGEPARPALRAASSSCRSSSASAAPDGAGDDHAPAAVLLDVDAHLRIADVTVGKGGAQAILELGDREPGRGDSVRSTES
jgi:hypothetical protein